MDEQFPDEPQPKKQGCMGCSWGCIIAGCLGVALLTCGGAATGLYYAYSKILVVYTDAIAKAKANTEVQAALGTTITEDIARIQAARVGNSVDFKIPLNGPNGKAILHGTAAFTTGFKWEYSVMEVEIENGRTINLMPTETEKPAK